MTETVTDIIVARSRQTEGLQKMVLWSAAGHAVMVVLLLFSGTSVEEDRRPPVMTISLGGAPGPRTGGLTQLGARAVQAAPTEAPEKVVPTPPAPVPPKMTLPDPRSKPQPPAKVDKAPPEATAKRANTGQPTDGNARADTGVVRGQGFGLSSAGGGGGPVQLDVTDFCCPDYLAQLVTLIQQSWDQNQGVVGSTTVKFTIARDGRVTMPQVEMPSGFLALDNSALRAVQIARLPPLPVAFQNPTLTIHMRFDYQR